MRTAPKAFDHVNSDSIAQRLSVSLCACCQSQTDLLLSGNPDLQALCRGCLATDFDEYYIDLGGEA